MWVVERNPHVRVGDVTEEHLPRRVCEDLVLDLTRTTACGQQVSQLVEFTGETF